MNISVKKCCFSELKIQESTEIGTKISPQPNGVLMAVKRQKFSHGLQLAAMKFSADLDHTKHNNLSTYF